MKNGVKVKGDWKRNWITTLAWKQLAYKFSYAPSRMLVVSNGFHPLSTTLITCKWMHLQTTATATATTTSNTNLID